jgi:hypothetical protein
MRPSFITLLVLSSILTIATAIKFELTAVTQDRTFEGTKCLSQYVAKDTLVLATVNVGEGYNQNIEFTVTIFTTFQKKLPHYLYVFFFLRCFRF